VKTNVVEKEVDDQEVYRNEVDDLVVDRFSMSRKGMQGEITGRILRDGTIGFDGDDFSRLMAEQAKPQRYGRLGPPSPDAELLSPQQVAVILGCSDDTVYKLIEDKRLHAVPLHGRKKIESQRSMTSSQRSRRKKRLLGIPRKELASFTKREIKKPGGET